MKKRADPGTFRVRPTVRPQSRFFGSTVFYCAVIVTVPKFTVPVLAELAMTAT